LPEQFAQIQTSKREVRADDESLTGANVRRGLIEDLLVSVCWQGKDHGAGIGEHGCAGFGDADTEIAVDRTSNPELHASFKPDGPLSRWRPDKDFVSRLQKERRGCASNRAGSNDTNSHAVLSVEMGRS